MFDKIKMGAITVDRIIAAAEGLDGLKKHKRDVIKDLAGKYEEVGKRLKAEDKNSVDLINQLRSKV